MPEECPRREDPPMRKEMRQIGRKDTAGRQGPEATPTLMIRAIQTSRVTPRRREVLQQCPDETGQGQTTWLASFSTVPCGPDSSRDAPRLAREPYRGWRT